MSSFYIGDVVDFQQDRAIVGAIYTTWSDGEIPRKYTDETIYIHRSTPAGVRNFWNTHRRIIHGYVLVEFLLQQDGFCLVAEHMLRLRDRGLVVDETVKRRPFDVQSGRVLSLVGVLYHSLPPISYKSTSLKPARLCHVFWSWRGSVCTLVVKKVLTTGPKPVGRMHPLTGKLQGRVCCYAACPCAKTSTDSRTTDDVASCRKSRVAWISGQ